PEGFAAWMLEQQRVLITDTTFRDAHQSLLATRMRSHDMLAVAPAYARMLPGLLSSECWGGATFDVSMRFLHECPWRRLNMLRDHMPNILLQMLLRASNGVGYKNYPDNVVRYFVEQAAGEGVDVFRIFDSLNWVDNMRVAIDAVRETDKLAEAAICYTGNLSDPAEDKYTLRYYVDMARELEAAGAHILGIKDMAGLCQPAAAHKLVSTLKQEVGLPIHFHTHDTSGISAASVLAAIDAGVDAVDAAMDSMSGLTSQPNMGSIVEALRHGPRESGLDTGAIRTISRYFEEVRECYRPFESDIRSGASEVYVHGMPGGQYTNLREQARSLGISDKWASVAQAYADVNDMFGNIVKVTPSSKVVGDMALTMVTGGLTREDVENPETDIAFPESVVSFFAGELGQPAGGFPPALQRKVLGDKEPMTERPGDLLPPLDLAAEREEAERRAERRLSDAEFAGYLMYPDVFLDFVGQLRRYGDLTVLPTTVFFYGMEPGDEITAEIENGKLLIVRYIATSEVHDESGERTVFFELNGQPRAVRVADAARQMDIVQREKVDPNNDRQVGAAMPGLVATLAVAPGDKVQRGDVLLTLEAMKMQTSVRSDIDGEIAEVNVAVGQQVESKDLLLSYR
ncbi:MAG: pyruvate carboxylase subunit B, partial [Gammaproteobacteria bacterium]|nr:pyruvate carboxylase subunit B [Gammaproteobacteria bacterium]